MNEYTIEDKLLDRANTSKIIVDITLNGKVAFQEILTALQHQFDGMYKIVTMNIEYLGKYNFGNMVIAIYDDIGNYKSINRILSDLKVKNNIMAGA
jgi:ABC-type methionine transport system ATPase subunit